MDRVNTASAEWFYRLASVREGHFRLESGHHGGVWLDLDGLFAEPRRIEPFVARLGASLQEYEVAAVCGPLLGGAFLAQLLARRLEVEFWTTQREIAPDTGGIFQARYRLPPAYAARVGGKRVAIVDDVMSAGSALRGTYSELKRHNATPVVAGALLVLGSTGADFFVRQRVAVEAAARDAYDLYLPDNCPLCVAAIPLQDGAAPIGHMGTSL